MTRAYFSFLLRMWKASDSKPPCWHASLEIPSSHETLYFHSISDCFKYLEKLGKDENINLTKNTDRPNEMTDLESG